MKKYLLLVLFAVVLQSVNGQKKITIEYDYSELDNFSLKDTKDDELGLSVLIPGDSTNLNFSTCNPTKEEKKLIWEIESDKSVLVQNHKLLGFALLTHPGDNILIKVLKNGLAFSGSGSKKCELLYAIHKSKKELPRPAKTALLIKTKEKFFEFNQYCDDALNKVIPFIASYKNVLSTEDYSWILRNIVGEIEWDRLTAFQGFSGSYRQSNPEKYNDLIQIFDSTQYKSWARWLRNQKSDNLSSVHYFYFFNREEVWKNFKFNYEDTILGSKPLRTQLYYENAKKNYKDLLLERVLCYLIEEQAIKEMGADHEMTQVILKDYYARSKFSGYKAWIKSVEDLNRSKRSKRRVN